MWEKTVMKMRWMSKEVATDQNALLLKQAEITGDIAYKKGQEQYQKGIIAKARQPEAGSIYFNAGRQDGMKEVVEWIEEMGLYWRSVSTTKHDYYIPLSLADTWQAFLKEKGLSDG